MRAVIAGETPTKGIEIVIATNNGERDHVVTWGSDLPSLLPTYKQAIKDAKAAKRKDGITRWVLVRQILVRETV